MKKTLTKIIGAGLIGVATLLSSGCKTFDSRLNNFNYSCPENQAQSQSLPEAKPVVKPESKDNNSSPNATISAFAKVGAGSIALGSGSMIGPFPSETIDVGVKIQYDNFTITPRQWVVYNNDGHVSELDSVLDVNYKFNDSFNLSTYIADWSCDIPHTHVSIFGLIPQVKFDDITITGTMFSDINSGGELYMLRGTKPLNETFTAGAYAGYSNGFLGGNMPTGLMHITPYLEAKLGKIGPLNVNASFGYQFGLEHKTDTIVGGVFFSGETAKSPLELRR